MTEKLDRIYVAWSSKGSTNWFDEPKAPTNYSDPLKIENYVKKAKKSLEVRAAKTPGAMTVSYISAEDESGTRVFDSFDLEHEASPAMAFYEFLEDFVKDFAGPADHAFYYRNRVVANEAGLLYAAIVCEQSALDVIRSGWRTRGSLFGDPYNSVTCMWNNVKYPPLSNYALGMSLGLIDEYETPHDECELLRKLCQRFKL